MRLARVGVEDVAGYLDGGAPAWARSGRPVGETEQIDVAELQKRLSERAPLDVLDVRRPGEWQAGRIERARGISLHELAARAAELDSGAPVAAICAGGYRSSIATSLLERAGFRKITNVVGGMTAWSGAGFETV